MSSKDDEILSINYSLTSMENTKKEGETKDKKINKNKSNASLGKKPMLFKNPSSLGLKNKKNDDFVSLPELKSNKNNNTNSRGSRISEKKLNYTSNSFNNKKNLSNINKNGNRTFNNSSTITKNKVNLYNSFDKDKIINNSKREESPTKTIEFLKKEIQNKNKIIESLISSNNTHNLPNNNNIVNILSTKKYNQKNEKNGQSLEDGEAEANIHNDSKVLEKKYNDIKNKFKNNQKKIVHL